MLQMLGLEMFAVSNGALEGENEEDYDDNDHDDPHDQLSPLPSLGTLLSYTLPTSHHELSSLWVVKLLDVSLLKENRTQILDTKWWSSSQTVILSC